MFRLILCLDDKPEQYREIQREAFEDNFVLIYGCRYCDVMEYLKGPHPILGVLLDFEMPFGTGVMYARHFVDKKFPIIITEVDAHGISRVVETLEEIKYPKELYINIPVKDLSWEKIKKFFNLTESNQIYAPV